MTSCPVETKDVPTIHNTKQEFCVMAHLRPLITICGTTGVGKSKLAIELALRLRQDQHCGSKGARIINADSMQVYDGLDIITNKVSDADKQGVEHLLMSFKKPGEQYVVAQWVQDAVEIVSGDKAGRLLILTSHS